MTEFFSRDPTRQLELCERENEMLKRDPSDFKRVSSYNAKLYGENVKIKNSISSLKAQNRALTTTLDGIKKILTNEEQVKSVTRSDTTNQLTEIKKLLNTNNKEGGKTRNKRKTKTKTNLKRKTKTKTKIKNKRKTKSKTKNKKRRKTRKI